MPYFAIVALSFLAQTAGQDVRLASAAASASCHAKYGEVVDFQRCASVALPDVTVRFVGVTQPTKGIPMSCWNYEASSGIATAEFKHCHTGALGGHANFAVADRPYTVVFDVASGCAKLPSGAWAPELRGHAFHSGVLSAEALEELAQRQSKAESACFARKGSP